MRMGADPLGLNAFHRETQEIGFSATSRSRLGRADLRSFHRETDGMSGQMGGYTALPLSGRPSMLSLGVRGAFASILPIEPITEDQMERLGIGIGGQAGGWTSKIPKPIKSIGKMAFKWMGPVSTTIRLGTETKGYSTLGKVEKGGRIIAEEMAWGAGMAMGASIGGSIGAAIGSTVPIVGTAIGAVAGMALGAAMGWGVNKLIDAAEAPAKAGYRVWKTMAAYGKASSRAELGGQISAANMSHIGATMRQRALGEMNRSGINMRSLLGREASLIHYR